MDVLKDESYISYDRTSRYSPFPYYYNTNDNKYMYGTTANLLDDTGYSIYTVEKGDTLDTIALANYNNPTYFWVLADFNRIQDPFEELTVGSQIKIPTFSNLVYDI